MNTNVTENARLTDPSYTQYAPYMPLQPCSVEIIHRAPRTKEALLKLKITLVDDVSRLITSRNQLRCLNCL